MRTQQKICARSGLQLSTLCSHFVDRMLVMVYPASRWIPPARYRWTEESRANIFDKSDVVWNATISHNDITPTMIPEIHLPGPLSFPTDSNSDRKIFDPIQEPLGNKRYTLPWTAKTSIKTTRRNNLIPIPISTITSKKLPDPIPINLLPQLRNPLSAITVFCR